MHINAVVNIFIKQSLFEINMLDLINSAKWKLQRMTYLCLITCLNSFDFKICFYCMKCVISMFLARCSLKALKHKKKTHRQCFPLHYNVLIELFY